MENDVEMQQSWTGRTKNPERGGIRKSARLAAAAAKKKSKSGDRIKAGGAERKADDEPPAAKVAKKKESAGDGNPVILEEEEEEEEEYTEPYRNEVEDLEDLGPTIDELVAFLADECPTDDGETRAWERPGLKGMATA